MTEQTKSWIGKLPGTCGTCIHFPICSKVSVKNAKEDTEYCLWGTKSGLYVEVNKKQSLLIPSVEDQNKLNKQINEKIKQ